MFVRRTEDMSAGYKTRRFLSNTLRTRSLTFQSFLLPTMTTPTNPVSMFRHYDPKKENFHTHGTPNPAPPSPARMGGIPQPPAQTKNTGPSNDAKNRLRQILPAPPTRDSKPNKITSPNGGSSGQEGLKIVFCSPKPKSAHPSTRK